MKMTGMKLGMMACCAIMVVPLVGYIAVGGSLASGGALSAALPLVACLALHGGMMFFMGKSCHGDKAENKADDAVVTTSDATAQDSHRIPVVQRHANVKVAATDIETVA